MTRYMVMGGAIGFIVAFASGIVTGHGLSTVLRDAMIGCLVLALITKFFYNALERSVTTVLEKEIEELEQKAMKERQDQAASDTNVAR